MNDEPANPGNAAAVSEQPSAPPAASPDARSLAAARAKPVAITEAANEPVPPTGIGVLVVNLGTPDAPTPVAVRRYLKEFLTDPRVIEKDSVLWKMLLNGIILPVRSRRKARLQKHLEPRQGRISVQDDHPFAGREACQHSRTARQACHRRLGDALR